MPPDNRGQWEYTPLGRILHVAGAGERLGTASMLRPIAEAIDPSVKAKLDQLQGGVYAGDVVNATFPPTSEFPSPLEKAGRVGAGMLLGSLVDPITYLTGGGSLAGRVRKVIGGTRAAGAIRAGGRALQRGHAAEQVLNRVGAPHLGRFLDDFTTGVSQKFGFNVGADPWLMRTHQELFSKITGAGKLRASQVIDDLEPFMDSAARRFSQRLKISPEEAMMKLRAAVTEATDAHPYIIAARDAKKGQAVFGVGPTRTPYDRARDAIQNNFGTPPSWGGPASPVDNDLTRKVREIVIQRNRMNSNILTQEEERLGRSLALHTHPDAGYSAGIISQEAKTYIDTELSKQMRGSLVGGPRRKGRSYTMPPSSHVAFEIARRMRTVDPAALQEYAAAGVLKPFSITVVRKGRKVVRTIDPQKWLEKDVGQLASRRTFNLIDKMVDAEVLSLDREASNYAGRLFPAIPTADKNRWIFENGHGLIKPGAVKNFFETDPTVIDAARGMAADRALLSQEWFDAVKARGTAGIPGESRIVAKEGAEGVPSNWVSVRGIPELDGYSMDPDAAKFMNRFYEADLNIGPAMQKFMKILKVGNTAFKSWTLAPFPAYHTRNALGLTWNYYLGSENQLDAIQNLHRSKQAWDAVRKGGKTARGWTLRGTKNAETGADWTASEIWRKVEENNGWGVGFISAENTGDIKRHIQYAKKYGLDDPERELLRGARSDWKAAGRKGSPVVRPPEPGMAEKIRLGLRGQNEFIERGFRIGSYVDDRFRMAHVIQKLKSGSSIEDSIRSMKKHFFDYSQLSPFERTYMREAIPFYAWSRKNLPYQMEMMVRRPDRLARFAGGLQTWEGTTETPPEEKYLNEWMKKNFSVRVRTNKAGQHSYFAFKNWLPLADIADIFHGWDWLTQGLTPWARIPLEQMMNENWFTDRKIDHMNHLLKGERTQFGTLRGVGLRGSGVSVPNRLAHIIKSIRLSSTAHQILDNPQEMDFITQLMRVIAGRTYPLDVGRSSYQLRKELEAMESNMRRAANSAAFAGHSEDVTRLVETFLKQRKDVLEKRGMR